MFTASLPPSIVASVTPALRVVKARPELRTQLWDNVDTLYDGLKRAAASRSGPQKGPVVAVHLPDRDDRHRLLAALLQAGVYVNLALPPATPNGVVAAALLALRRPHARTARAHGRGHDRHRPPVRRHSRPPKLRAAGGR